MLYCQFCDFSRLLAFLSSLFDIFLSLGGKGGGNGSNSWLTISLLPLLAVSSSIFRVSSSPITFAMLALTVPRMTSPAPCTQAKNPATFCTKLRSRSGPGSLF